MHIFNNIGTSFLVVGTYLAVYNGSVWEKIAPFMNFLFRNITLINQGTGVMVYYLSYLMQILKLLITVYNIRI